MSTLTTVIARQPAHFQARYAIAYWVKWMNDLLEELSGDGFLFPSQRKEYGARVTRDIWVTKPTGVREIGRICNPADRNTEYNFIEIENKIRLLDVEISESVSPDTASTFSSYALGSIAIQKASVTEDQYANYLLIITAGTAAGQTIIIESNTASAGSPAYSTLYFRHDTPTLLSGTAITACSLIPATDFVVMECSTSYSEVVDGTSEIPIDDKYERRITNAYLRWKIEEEISTLSPEVRYFEEQFNSVKTKLKGELRNNAPRGIQARDLPGLKQYTSGLNSLQQNYQYELYGNE